VISMANRGEPGRGGVSQSPEAIPPGMFANLSVGILSYRAHKTLDAALQLHAAHGLQRAAAEFFVYFNALEEADREIAARAGVAFSGSAENAGIYGGFRSIAELASKPYVLILENDVVPFDGADVIGCLRNCLSDMEAFGIKIFCVRSRENPGQGDPWKKYIKCFPIARPINPKIASQQTPWLSRVKMLAEHGYLSKFKGAAFYAEKAPHTAQPSAIRRLPSGNYLTDSRFRNWSNLALLVERRFFLDIVCHRVETNPDPRLVNGNQDIERALNSWWWRRRREPMGHAGKGAFTHARLDR